MRYRQLLFLICLPVLLYVCEVIASLFYCALTNRMALFTYPYLQWWTLFDYWSSNWAMPPLIVLSGLVGLLPLILVTKLVFPGRGKQGRSLYGKQNWADAEALRKGGIQLKQRQ